MKIQAAVMALALILPGAAGAQEPAFSLPALPYAVDALAPAIDKQTMEIHHGKHHQAYVNNLNAEVEKTPALKGKTLGHILTTVSQYGPAVRNNAGGHWNHSFFWNIMTPAAQSGAPSEALTAAINNSFGSLDKFKEAFEKAGAGQFGSGWVWLVVSKDKTLEIITTPYQDNPLMDDAKTKGLPILGNDVWEHAYYLGYQNRRGDYLKNWWQVVNWKVVSDHYDTAVKQR